MSRRAISLPKILVLGSCLSLAQSLGAVTPHPRIWLDSQKLADLIAKKNANHPDWVAIKAKADVYLNKPILGNWTITSVTNANPAEFTIVETLPYAIGSKSGSMYFGAFTQSGWTTLNAPIPPLSLNNGFQIITDSAHTFHIVAYGTTTAVDSTTWAPFGTQTPVVFVEGGQTAATIPYDYEGHGWWYAATSFSTVYKVLGNAA